MSKDDHKIDADAFPNHLVTLCFFINLDYIQI
jgi:hypothetical protein